MDETSLTGKVAGQPAAEDRRRTGELDFRALAETLPHLVWSARPDGFRDYFNVRLLNYLGKTLEELQGWTWQEMLHPDDRQRTIDAWNKAKTEGTELCVEYRIRRGADGMYRWHEGRAMPVRDAAGNIVRWFGTCTDIEERKQVEERYHRFANLTSDYVHYCTRTGSAPFRIQWIDGAINPISGYSIENILEQGCFLSFVHPDDRQTLEAYLFGMAPGDCKSIEFRIVTKDEDLRWVSEKSYCEAGVSEGELILYGAVTDITERKITQEWLRLSEEKFSKAFHRSPLLMTISYVETGRYLDVNEMFCRISGFSREEIIGRTSVELGWIQPEDRQLLLEELRAKGRVAGVELKLTGKAGTTIWCEYFGELISTSSGEMLLSIAQDITARKCAEEALAHAKEAAEAASQAKSQFLANMSHEIRTPITGILGMAELLEHTELSERQKNFLGTLFTSTESLLALVNDILDLSKIEAGKVELEHKDFNLRDLVNEVIGSQAPLAQARGLAIKTDLPVDVTDKLTGDPFRLKQILLNLVGNAIKFTERGTVALLVTVEEQQSAKALLRFDVTDTGIGIRPEDLARIFTPFSQADYSMTRKYGGTGLGLAICTQLSTLMGGEIWVDSCEGIGSTFHLRIPFSVSDTPAKPNGAPQVARPPLWEDEPLRILLAEDNETTRILFGDVLSLYGHSVEIAASGAEALEKWGQASYDIILMDVQMPVMDGIEAVTRIREVERAQGGHIPVVAVTAHAMDRDRLNLLSKGFDGYVSKPTKIKDLFSEMKRCLARQPGNSPD